MASTSAASPTMLVVSDGLAPRRAQSRPFGPSVTPSKTGPLSPANESASPPTGYLVLQRITMEVIRLRQLGLSQHNTTLQRRLGSFLIVLGAGRLRPGQQTWPW